MNQHFLFKIAKKGHFVKGKESVEDNSVESSPFFIAKKRGVPRLEKKEVITSHKIFEGEESRVILRKGVCGSVWCPSCFKRKSLKRIRDRLLDMDWKRLRHVVLTFDRKLFTGAIDGYEYVAGLRKIPNMIWNLRRTKGVKVSDWLWVLEWHEDGFPHWHLFIEVADKGMKGMIGGNNLRHYWGLGGVDESYIRDERHWLNLIGYFGDHGYFGETKGHQGALPEWAKDWSEKTMRKIRRWGAMVLPDEEKVEGTKSLSLWKEKVNGFRGYRATFERCGSRTKVEVYVNRFWTSMVVDVPYKELREKFREVGEYKPGIGFEAMVDWGDLCLLSEMFDGMVPLVEKIIGNLEYWGQYQEKELSC